MQTDTSKSGRWNLLFNRYKSVMNIIIRANNELFRREKPMCEALMELMQEDLRVKGISSRRNLQKENLSKRLQTL